jgi:hypothetical protein
LFFPDYTLEAALIAVDLARRLNPLQLRIRSHHDSLCFCRLLIL